MNCFCDNEDKTSDHVCVICKNVVHTLMTTEERVWECHKIILRGCGMRDFICNSCMINGWSSTKGNGGPTMHINKITGEKRKIPYPQGPKF